MLFLVLNVSLPSNSYTSSYKDISEIEDLHFVCVCICVRGLIGFLSCIFVRKSTYQNQSPIRNKSSHYEKIECVLKTDKGAEKKHASPWSNIIQDSV